jgi:hypothetical protein
VKFLRRCLLLISFGALIFSSVLLLNFTAPNPTGRRYSSEIPPENIRGRDGGNAEIILSIDLGVHQNTITPPRQCICNSSFSNSLPRSNCDVCTLNSEVERYHIPDFVTDAFIIEAKNYSPNSGDVYSQNGNQLDAYLIMAHQLNRPFWLFVAVDSVVRDELRLLAEATGGGVVYYFTVAGYVDPIDTAAKGGITVSSTIFALSAIWEVWSLRRLRIRLSPPKQPTPRSASKPTPTPRDPLHKAASAVQNAEQFNSQSRETAWNELDQKDANEESYGDE